VVRAMTVAFLLCAMAAATARAATTAEVAGWLASTKKVMRMPSPPYAPHFAGAQRYVRVAGTEISGWIDPAAADHGFLRNDQEVMLLPVVSGGSGGVFATLVFTRLGGRTQFVGLIPSPNGHLDVTLAGGAILVRTPIYKANDPNCCPSGFHFERDTLHGMTLVKLNQYDTKR
jgi:hypothetical protein